MANESLREHFNKSQAYLKLGDKEKFDGAFISWEAVKTKFGKNGYGFTLERDDGSRIKWTTSNSQAVNQFADLIDKGLKKGSLVTIIREGLDKTDTRYTITERTPF